jgi:hypothetical protein
MRRYKLSTGETYYSHPDIDESKNNFTQGDQPICNMLYFANFSDMLKLALNETMELPEPYTGISITRIK